MVARLSMTDDILAVGDVLLKTPKVKAVPGVRPWRFHVAADASIRRNINVVPICPASLSITSLRLPAERTFRLVPHPRTPLFDEC
jgi:hypothetical protein